MRDEEISLETAGYQDLCNPDVKSKLYGDILERFSSDELTTDISLVLGAEEDMS